MISVLSWLLLTQPVSARKVERFIVLCGDDTLHHVCSSPRCDSDSARTQGDDACRERGGVTSRASRVLRFRDIKSELADAAMRLDKKRHLDELRESARIRDLEQARAAEERRERQAIAAKEAEERYQRRMELAALREAELAQAEEEKKKVLDAEFDSCAERMTYPFRLWVCPTLEALPDSRWVVDPVHCPDGPYEESLGRDHAREIDFGISMLPPGKACVFSYGEEDGGYRSFTADEYNLSLIHSVHEVAQGGDYPAWLTVDLGAVEVEVFNAWVQAHAGWMNSRPYDCLGGVCLNAWSSGFTPKLVTVARTPMNRTVEVCQNRVAAIYLAAGWVDPRQNFEWVDIPPGAVIDTYSDGSPGLDFFRSVGSEMTSMGWESEYSDLATFSHHPHRQGTRATAFERSSYGTGWAVTIHSQHPRYYEMCKGELREGL